MSDSDTLSNQLNADQEDAEMAAPDELTLLKQRADMLGITYASRIGVDKLKAKIEAKLNGTKEEGDADEASVDEPELTEQQKFMKLREEMLADEMKLIRLRITNLNPNKRELHGEIFTVANKAIGIVKKYVPYGEATEDGYHVPNVIYKQLKERKFLNIRTYRNKTNGEIVVEQTWAPEFALEVLPQLTQEELNHLAAAQAAAGIN